MEVGTAQSSSDKSLVSAYDSDVLQLARGQSEQDLDTQLRTQAEELGIVYEVPKSKETMSTPRSEDSSTYSTSVDSRTSVSTSITSWSRDRTSLYSNDTQDYPHSKRSLNIDMSRRQSTSSSAFSASTASTSSSRKSAFQRFKSLGMRLHKSSRSDHESCPHCPKVTASRRRALHELSCGHRLCTPALRNVVVDAIRQQATPMCCQVRLPDGFIRHVLTGDELLLYDQRQTSADTTTTPPSPRRDSPLLLACHTPMSHQHVTEHARFETWLAKAKADLQRQRSAMLQLLQEQHLKALDEQLEAQAIDLSIAEDRQVKAEADLRSLQEQEIKDNATALRHMEAYCAGHMSSGQLHNRTITEQDMKELQKTQAVRNAMQQKHHNAINILRGEQTRRMRVRSQRHDEALHLLQSRQRKEVLAFEQRLRADEAAFDVDCTAKRQRLQYRWELQDMIRERRAHHITLEPIAVETA